MKRMSNTYITGASMVALTFSLNITNANAASTCAAMPTCAEMGYTEYSCGNGAEAIKCPFDTTKVKCIIGCDISEYTKTSCDTTYGEVCVKCGNKYKHVGCSDGYVDYGSGCTTHSTGGCLNYSASTPTGGNFDEADKCRESTSVVKYKVICPGMNKGWGYYNASLNSCEVNIKPGDVLRDNVASGVTREFGIVLDVYKESNTIKIDYMPFTAASQYTYFGTFSQWYSGSVPAEEVAQCAKPYKDTLSEVLAAKRQHNRGSASACGTVTAWNGVDAYKQEDLTQGAFSNSTFFLANPYLLKKAKSLGLLQDGVCYWSSINASPATGSGPKLNIWILGTSGNIEKYSYMAGGASCTVLTVGTINASQLLY